MVLIPNIGYRVEWLFVSLQVVFVLAAVVFDCVSWPYPVGGLQAVAGELVSVPGRMVEGHASLVAATRVLN